jgi:hypothetical protein
MTKFNEEHIHKHPNDMAEVIIGLDPKRAVDFFHSFAGEPLR